MGCSLWANGAAGAPELGSCLCSPLQGPGQSGATSLMLWGVRMGNPPSSWEVKAHLGDPDYRKRLSGHWVPVPTPAPNQKKEMKARGAARDTPLNQFIEDGATSGFRGPLPHRPRIRDREGRWEPAQLISLHLRDILCTRAMLGQEAASCLKFLVLPRAPKRGYDSRLVGPETSQWMQKAPWQPSRVRRHQKCPRASWGR